MILCDPSAERAVLSGILQYGETAFLDISDIIQESSFTIDSNQIIYKCLKEICEKNSKPNIDMASIYSVAQELGLSHILAKKEEAQHLKAIKDFPVNIDNIRKFAAKIRKLEIARSLHKALEVTQEKLLDVTGSETISSILGIAEDSIFNFSSSMNNDGDGSPELMGEGIEEYIEYLQTNIVDQVGISTGFPVYDQAIGGGLRRGTVNVIGARPKAQPLSSKILTPNGWITMGEVKIGDVLIDPSKAGATTKVIGIFPFGKREVFEFTFSDGAKARSCADHLWKVKERKDKNYKILSLNQMLEQYSNILHTNNSNGYVRPRWQFPVSKAIEFSNKKINYIDPYVLGCLLGDGGLTKNNIILTTADVELLEEVNSNLKDNYYFKKTKEGKHNKYDYRLNSLNKISKVRLELCKLKLHGKNSYTKFIPKQYKISSIKTRTELLQGLFDTDGSVSNGYGIDYTTASHKLARDIKEIVLSLGGLCSINSKFINYKGKRKKYYRLYIAFNDISKYFRLSRKKKECIKRTKTEIKRSLVSVRSIGSEIVQCIRVNSEEQLYITDDYVVTKNTGKTLLSDNMGRNVAKLGIPVLNMDTEMSKKDHIHRLLAMATEIEINKIETGRFSDSPVNIMKIVEAGKELKGLPLKHKVIAGKPFEEQLAIMRRWIVKDVGLKDDGTAKDCVIFYDYLKLMDTSGMDKDLKEYQLLGFMMTALHNFAVKYQVPIVAFIQLNRDGITKESTDSASGSDRIIWLCSNFSIFKRKSDEEIAEDGPDVGNRKLIPVISRHGGGLDDNDYINCHMKGWCAKIIEGKTKLESMHNVKSKKDGFIVNDTANNEEEIPFV